ncbi:hypothetical protein, partial [Polaribacter sp.]|uniref:hypothetical protein n=1 Tax=Polaribacter sp. TaxID=1920175 RepID=UPI003F6D99CE
MESENIDKLFKEKLNDINAKPSDKVWQGIERNLNKKKRKIIPFWWFSGAAAAVLLISLFFYKPTPKADKRNNDQIIITDKPSEPATENQKIIRDTLLKKTPKKDAIYVADTKEEKQQKHTKNTTIKLKNKIAIRKKSIVSKNDAKEVNINKKNDKSLKTNNITEADSLKKSNFLEAKKTSKDFIAIVENVKKDNLKEKQKTSKNKWSISTVVAVLNANSFSDSSPIDANLAKSTVGKNSFSYGVQVAFKINDKWSIQSGIHQQKIAYQNTDITVLNSAV